MTAATQAPARHHFWDAFTARMRRTLLARTISRYLTFNGPVWATLVAWNILFAFFPIVLLAAAVIGFALRGQGLDTSLRTSIASALPGTDGTVLAQGLEAARSSAGVMAILAAAGLIWSGSALFGSIDQSLSALYPAKQRSFLSQKLMSVVMVVVFVVLVVAALATSSALAFVQGWTALPGWLRASPVTWVIQTAAGVLIGWILMATIFAVVPNRRPRRSAIACAALLGGIAFEITTLLFPLYFSLEHGFATYGATMGLFFVMLTYAYILAQIVVIAGSMMVELDPPPPAHAPDSVAMKTEGRPTPGIS